MNKTQKAYIITYGYEDTTICIGVTLSQTIANKTIETIEAIRTRLKIGSRFDNRTWNWVYKNGERNLSTLLSKEEKAILSWLDQDPFNGTVIHFVGGCGFDMMEAPFLSLSYNMDDPWRLFEK